MSYSRLILILLLFMTQPIVSAQELVNFNIPASNADNGLRIYVEQAGRQILFPFDLINKYQTNPVHGDYTVDEALDNLLRNTGLEAVVSSSGTLSIRIVESVTVNEQPGLLERIVDRLSNVLMPDDKEIEVVKTDSVPYEEIIVTGRKRGEYLQDIPVAVSVFTNDKIYDVGIRSTRDLFNFTPGLNYDTGFDQNAGTPAIRGVVSNEIATYRQKVTSFLDGMPILGQQGSIPLLAVEQVEVFRGPQSAAFGRSTFGGAINYKTVDPGDEFEAEIYTDIGNNDFFELNGLVSGPLIEGNVSGLLAFAHRERDGEDYWTTRTENLPLGGEETRNILAKLVLSPTENSSIELRYKWLDVDNEQTPRVFCRSEYW